MAFNMIRKKTPCRFSDGLSQQEFETLAIQISENIERITDIWFDEAIIHCTVVSLRRISKWNFTLDFNDWGHVTGTFWTYSENDDSSIPHNFGMTMSGLIHEALHEKNIDIRDMSNDVDSHENLDQLIDKGIHSNRGFWRFINDVILGNPKKIAINHSDWEMVGEHLYPVFALLMDNGFENISVQKIKDVDNTSNHYEFEIDEISIGGCTSFKRGKLFDYNSNIIIKYHTKREIKIPFPVSSLIRQNYIVAGDRLQEIGFTNIYERKIKDLVIGIIIRAGTTEMVVVKENDGTEIPLQNGISYFYDTQIIICYHTYKK